VVLNRREEAHLYLRNSWYVAAWQNEIASTPVARTILDDPIVLFRKTDGSVAALEDRCVHRHAPLHLGRVLGDELQCGYHGLVYNSHGRCTRVPGQDRIPVKACIKSYKVVEKYGWVWVWMGRPECADERLVPDFARMTDPAFAPTGATSDIGANYELINDNLLDLSHVGYVHGFTIGTTEMGENGRIKVERTDNGVRVTRWVLDCPPPPTHIKTGVFTETDRVDRWQIIDYVPPSFVKIYVGSAPAGTGAPQGNRVGGLGMWIMNAMTPVTASTTKYFWGVGRDFQVDNPEMTKVIHGEIAATFLEDKHILEEQQKVIHLFVDPENVDIVADAGVIQARRLLRQRIKDELQGEASVSAEMAPAIPVTTA
jgi:phenylpropionate dioxygenase-like ring-hydroxylating dioxygenase large terminal subunit